MLISICPIGFLLVLASHSISGIRVRSHIWEGSAVREDGKLPSFVALLWLNENVGKVSMCGGTLYRRKYILTAGHCILWGQKLLALLNPTRNPMHMIDSRNQLPDDDPLWGTRLKPTKELEVFIPEDYRANGLMGRYPDRDLALIILAEAPYSETDVAWESVDVTIPDEQPNVTAAKMYGIGFTNPETHPDHFNGLPATVLEDTLEILTYASCMRRCSIAWWVNIQNGAVNVAEQKDAVEKFEHYLNSQAQNVQGMWQAGAKLAMAHSSGKMSDAATQSSRFRTEGTAARENAQNMTEILELLGFDLTKVREGKLLCAFGSRGGVQQGDSGGPLVSTSQPGLLLGVASWAIGPGGGEEIPEGNKLEYEGFGGLKGTRTSRFPGFFVSTVPHKNEIDAAIDCDQGAQRDELNACLHATGWMAIQPNTF